MYNVSEIWLCISFHLLLATLYNPCENFYPFHQPATTDCGACCIVFCLASTGDCELGPSWLLWLCVVFGVLFLVMLCVNVFLCSAMTCSFSRTEVTTLTSCTELVCTALPR